MNGRYLYPPDVRVSKERKEEVEEDGRVFILPYQVCLK